MNHAVFLQMSANSAWDVNFGYFYLFLIAINILLPVIFVLWPRSARQSGQAAKPSYRDVFGWVLVTLYMAAICGVLELFVVQGAVEKVDEHASDAWAFVLFAFFCAGVLLWMLYLCLTMMRAKLREVRKLRQKD